MSQKDLIVLLYNGALKFLDQAKEEIDKRDTDKFADRIERVHRIVQHLYTTLDFEAGGEIAEKLGALYTFVIGQLYILNSTRNIAIIADLKDILGNLKEGWENLGKGIPGETDVSNNSNQDIETDNTDNAVSTQVQYGVQTSS